MQDAGRASQAEDRSQACLSWEAPLGRTVVLFVRVGGKKGAREETGGVVGAFSAATQAQNRGQP